VYLNEGTLIPTSKKH